MANLIISALFVTDISHMLHCPIYSATAIDSDNIDS